MSFLRVEVTGQQIEHRLWARSAGLSLSSIVFAILTSQLGLYLCNAGIHRRDPLWTKSVAILIWVIQASEFALACHMQFVHKDESALPIELVKEWLRECALYIATCAATECLVHAYFISQIYRLETSQLHITSIVLAFILFLEGAFAFICALSVGSYHAEQSGFVVLLWSLPVWLGLSTLMDILIACSICHCLKKHGPFVSTRLHLLVKRLTKFCIQTGLVTSLVTGITIVLWITAQLDPGHLLMSFPIGGIYAICFMANLIARESYFKHVQLDHDNEYPEMARSDIVFAIAETSSSEEMDNSAPHKGIV